MKTFTLISAVAVLFLSACDRHQWEGEDGVKELYIHEEEHGGGHGGHGEGHDEKGHDEKADDDHGHGADDAHKKEEKAH